MAGGVKGMKVLKYLTTKKQIIAVVRNERLFEQDSFFVSDRHDYETVISGRLKGSGEEAIYAFGYDRRYCTREYIQRWLQIEPDWFDDIKTDDVRSVAQKSEQQLISTET